MSYLYMNTTVRFKEVVRLTSNQIISTSACFNLIGCWDFVFQTAVSPPVPCPALAPPPLSQRAPPLISPSMTKRKSARNSALGNVGRLCLSSTHARTHARTHMLICVFIKVFMNLVAIDRICCCCWLAYLQVLHKSSIVTYQYLQSSSVEEL